MAETIQTGVRYVLVALGIVTVVLAVWMARENLWWMAVPDACFGIGVGWMALASGHAGHQAPLVVEPAAPAPPARPDAAPEPVSVAARPQVQPPAAPAAPGAGQTAPAPPGRSGKKKKRRR